MNKIKKAIADLREYLGRDTAALNLLMQVEIVANDVRKEAASERERADNATAGRRTAAVKLHESHLEISRLRDELSREQSLRGQRDRDVEKLTQKVSELEKHLEGDAEDQPESLDLMNLSALRSSIKALRRWKRLAPTGQACRVEWIKGADPKVHDRTLPVHNIETLIKDLSNGELMILGRYVAVRALMNMPVVVRAKKNISFTGENGDTVRILFVSWLREQIDHNGPDSKLADAAEGRPTPHELSEIEHKIKVTGSITTSVSVIR